MIYTLISLYLQSFGSIIYTRNVSGYHADCRCRELKLPVTFCTIIKFSPVCNCECLHASSWQERKQNFETLCTDLLQCRHYKRYLQWEHLGPSISPCHRYINHIYGRNHYVRIYKLSEHSSWPFRGGKLGGAWLETLKSLSGLVHFSFN